MPLIMYFVDHKNKKIHHQQYAGDKCGFLETPISEREFTASDEYVKSLEGTGQFSFCKECETPQLVM
ncbi:hypothetical protein D2909_01400 [Planococcus salinarum]|nr:hypothetical protein D2909_01400 [Planococcus salinarum]